jgi:hypothetical protein
MTEAELATAMYRTAQIEMAAFKLAEMVDGTPGGARSKAGGRRTKRQMRLDDYRACAEAGLSKTETARKLGVTTEAARHFIKKHGIIFRDGRRK